MLPNPILLTDYHAKQQRFWACSDDVFDHHEGAPIVLPARSLSDGLSVPKIFQSFFSKSPYFIHAGRLHDHLYKIGSEPSVSRVLADQLFRYYMKLYGVGLFKRNIIYSAVRVGGWKSYKKQTLKFKQTN